MMSSSSSSSTSCTVSELVPAALYESRAWGSPAAGWGCRGGCGGRRTGEKALRRPASPNDIACPWPAISPWPSASSHPGSNCPQSETKGDLVNENSRGGWGQEWMVLPGRISASALVTLPLLPLPTKRPH